MSKNDESGAALDDEPAIYKTTAYSDDLKEFMCRLVDVLAARNVTIKESREIFELAGFPVPETTLQGWQRKRKAQGQLRTPNKKSGRPRILSPEAERVIFGFVLSTLDEKKQ